MKFKKCLAIFMASAIMVSAGSSAVFAESYQETEKANFTEWVQNYTGTYKKMLDLNGDSPSVAMDLSVSITDTSRALLGLVSPVDISWLNDIGFAYNVSLVNGVEAIVGNIHVNDQNVCNLEIYLDTASQSAYMRVPELHDSYLYVDMAMAAEETAEMTASMELLSDPMALMPDAAVLETLLTRYSAILFDSFGEDAASDASISVEGVEEACKAYRGMMQAEDAQNFLRNILTTAKEDNELKTIIEQWAPLMNMESESGDIYIDFRTAINDLLEDLEEEDYTNDGSYISSKIWVDADNNIVGREIGFVDSAAGEEEIFFTYKAPSTETESALFVEINADGEVLAISGKGAVSEGKISGTYDFMYDSVVMASVDVVDYVPADTAAGGLNGSYKLYLQPGIGEENYASLSSFDVVADITTNMETFDQAYALTLNMSGSPMGTIDITGSYCDPVAVPDFVALTNVLDLAAEDDAVTFVSEMDWAPILDNCVVAGMPEEVAAMLDELIYNSLYGVSYEDDYYEDYSDEAFEDDYYEEFSDDVFEDGYYEE